MNRQDFVLSLKWVDENGPEPNKYNDFSRPLAALVESEDGTREVVIVGDVNLMGGECDCHNYLYRKKVIATAYLWEE